MQQHHLTGLTAAQVEESRLKYGANVLTPPEKETLWDKFKGACRHWIAISMGCITILSLLAAFIFVGNIGSNIWVMPIVLLVATVLIFMVGFFGGFNDPLFKILITAFVFSVGIAIYEFMVGGADFTAFFEPIGIIVALLLATGVAWILERSNEKTFQSLNEVNDDTLVKVIRDGNVRQVPRRDIVVGDIVIIETGEEVPADCELVDSLNLIVNESSLTGEPQANKTTDPSNFDKDATYPSNHIMKGSTVIEGYCTAKVFAVGDSSECGKVFEAAQVDEGEPTPLSEKLNTLADWISKASYIVAALIIVGRIITYFFVTSGEIASLQFVTYLLNTIMIAVTLVVVAVPEGLPMSITLSLAFSMKKLMKEKTLPRTMHSCETMGAAAVICTDKTGTLTQNQMQVWEADLDNSVDKELIAEMIAVNTTANLDFSDETSVKAIGNPTEGALLLWLNSQGVNYQNIREKIAVDGRLPFTTINKYMASVVQSVVEGKKMLYVKGAPEILLGMSDIADDIKKKYEAKLLEYQSKAMRTLALCFLECNTDAEPFVDGHLAVSKLKFAGIFAISDPVRSDVPNAIRSCIDAGIQVKIVTGDTPGTAKEIGRQVGLWTPDDGDSNILTGTDFAAMDDNEVSARLHDLKILSRARPNDKERLVKLLKRQNLVVAATGDGTNDAPALNAADVGLSMGDGTADAKEASDMTILDNSFSTITNAVMWGRSLYKNIQRFIMFQMTINVVACLIVLIGAFSGTESPLTVTQMLWVNLIMDTFAAIALASLPPDRNVMKDRPRKVSDYIISRGMALRIFGIGGLFTVIMVCLLLVMQHTDITSFVDLFTSSYGEYNGLSDYELSMFFSMFVMFQFWNMFNAKAFMTGRSAFANLSNCKGFLIVAAIIFVGQIIIVEIGGQMFSVCHLKPSDWLWIILTTSLVLWIGEAGRLVARKK